MSERRSRRRSVCILIRHVVDKAVWDEYVNRGGGSSGVLLDVALLVVALLVVALLVVALLVAGLWIQLVSVEVVDCVVDCCREQGR